jgi:hypothetical protein
VALIPPAPSKNAVIPGGACTRLRARTHKRESPSTLLFDLAFFLQDFTIPDGSNNEERALYFQLVQRLDKAGELVPGARERIEEKFRIAAELRRRSRGF